MPILYHSSSMQPTADIIRCVKPVVACVSGSLMLGCALHTLYSALCRSNVSPGHQLETAARLAAFSARMWLAQLGLNSVDVKHTVWPVATDAALSACGHMLATRLSAHAERLLASPYFPGQPDSDLGLLLFSFAIHLATGACILFGRFRARVILSTGGMDGTRRNGASDVYPVDR